MKNKIAIIVEGVKDEPKLFSNLMTNVFENSDVKIIYLYPWCCNIYDLWAKLNDDDYETDLIELIRERYAAQKKSKWVEKVNASATDYETLNKKDFSEIYLFFDYDGHSNNLPKGVNTKDALLKLLSTFDNETENGKLYISYPMIEAVKHFRPVFGPCHENPCFFKVSQGSDYKRIVNSEGHVSSLNKYTIDDWEYILKKHLINVSCLLNYQNVLDVEEYKNAITPAVIYEKQLDRFISEYGHVMILSAFPEFLLDYYKTKIFKKKFNLDRINIEFVKDCKYNVVKPLINA